MDKNDPKLTAYVLGELSGSEISEVRTAIERDTALQQEIEAIRATVIEIEALMRAETESDRKSDVESAQMLRTASATDFAAGKNPGRRWRTLVLRHLLYIPLGMMSVVVVIGLMFARPGQIARDTDNFSPKIRSYAESPDNTASRERASHQLEESARLEESAPTTASPSARSVSQPVSQLVSGPASDELPNDLSNSLFDQNEAVAEPAPAESTIDKLVRQDGLRNQSGDRSSDGKSSGATANGTPFLNNAESQMFASNVARPMLA
ncbi:MAG TPA: hypothetical protein DEB39_14350, partial [Planctomycetaceae bacterium]|nr:hypothetical protein [Planctomycetaceae bacterium]